MQGSKTLKIYVESVGILTGLCLGLFIVRILLTHTLRYWFIPENLALAWLSLGLAWLLVSAVAKNGWRNFKSIALGVLWLLFLPNTWYVLTDFIHVYPNGEINELYDITLIVSLIFAGFSLGLTSLYLVHKQLSLKMKPLQSYMWAEGAILLSSFAIYLGRDLRWSTWDVVTNPGGLIVSVTDRIINPLSHTNTLSVTTLMFVTLSVVYFAFWRGIQLFHASKTAE